jgi:hypothetical protein
MKRRKTCEVSSRSRVEKDVDRKAEMMKTEVGDWRMETKVTTILIGRS